MPGIHRFKRIGSTQERAKLLAEQGAPEGTIVRADRQTRGRGRFKRRWESPEGGLWFSMVLYPAIDPARAWQLTMVCAVALAAGIRKGAGIRVGLKWPNDIVYKTKKVGGILTETSAA